MSVDFSLLAQNASILIVDDTVENLSLLTRLVKDCGYIARPVPNGRLALQAARSQKPDLILLDITMPEMDGYEVCRQLKIDKELKEIPVLFISALSMADEKVKAFEAGGVDYITKPFQLEEVRARVETHLKLHRLQMSLADQVEKQVQEITDLQMSMIFGLAKLAEARDYETGRHLERIQTLCKLFADHLHENKNYVNHVNENYCNLIFHASPLHDIGKVGIPDHILLKPGKLDAEEFEMMKTHSMIGARTLEEVQSRFRENDFLKMGIKIARSHHEKWNGSGYPDGLAGTKIPLCARIMAIVDVYDAIRSRRVYKPPYSHKEATEIILSGCGTHFDPDLVENYRQLEDSFEQIWKEYKD